MTNAAVQSIAPAQAPTTLHTVLYPTTQAAPCEIDNYPYGPTQVTKKQYWVETATRGLKNGKMRVVTRVQNPKTGTWGAPKVGAFADLAFLYIDADTGSIEGASISVGSTSAIKAFKATWYDVLPADLQAKLEVIEKRDAKLNENVWEDTVPSQPIAEPDQVQDAPYTPAPVVEVPAEVPVEVPAEVVTPVEETVEQFEPFPAVPADTVFAKVLQDVNLQAQGLDASLIKVPGKGYVLRYDNVDICEPSNLKFIQGLLAKQERALENEKDYFEGLVKKLTAPKPAKAAKASVVNPTAAGKSDNYYRPQRAKGDSYEIQPQAVALPVRANSKIGAIIDALKAGLAVSEIATVLNDASADEAYVQGRVTKRGYGIRKADGILTLIEPEPASTADAATAVEAVA